MSDCCSTPTPHLFSSQLYQLQVNFQCDDDEARFEQDQHA
jgi:hypothetical protein